MADIFIAGIGRQPPKKFDMQLKESEKQLYNLRKFGTSLSKYQQIDYRSLNSIKLASNPLFVTLKSEIDRFNQEVREAIEKKTEMLTYPWKYVLYTGLRNLLRVICDTHDAPMQQVFLKQASEWFYDQLAKKTGAGNSRPGTSQAQPRPETSQQKMMVSSLLIQSPEGRPTTSQRFDMTQRPETSQRFGTRPQTSYDQMMPSEFKATVFSDYEAGNRTKYTFNEPPYDRVNNYERKLPNQIVKPFSSQSSMRATMTTRPGTSPNFFTEEFRRTTSGFRNHDPAFNPSVSRGFPMFVVDKESSPRKGDRYEEADDGEVQVESPAKADHTQEEGKAQGEGEEEEEEGEEEEAKVVGGERKLYTNDRLTGYVQMIRDQLVPVEDRSNNAFFAPNGEIHELQAEQRWREAQHREVIKKREREEIISMIDEWAHAKSRVEDESARRGESMRHASQFEHRAFSPRPRTTQKDAVRPQYREVPSRPGTTLPGMKRVVPSVVVTEIEKEWPPKNLNLESDDDDDEPSKEPENKGPVVTIYREKGKVTHETVRLSNIFDYQSTPTVNMRTGARLATSTSGIEAEMNRMKLNRVREVHGNFIKSRQSVTPTEGKRRPPSMSVFQRAESVRGIKRPKPLSLITKSLTSFKQAQVEEIDQIKKKLAQSQVHVSLKTLSRALLVPEPTPKEFLSPLPMMGSRLMMNPFITDKKKKKKKVVEAN